MLIFDFLTNLQHPHLISYIITLYWHLFCTESWRYFNKNILQYRSIISLKMHYLAYMSKTQS